MRDALMFLLCSVCAFQTARSQVPTAPGIIPRLVADAQASAKTRVSVGMTRVTFAVNKSLNQSLISQVPLMVLIEGRAASVSLMGDNIWTWYRAKVVNNPGGIQIPQMAIPPFSLEVVPPTLTLSADEILIRNPGGDLVINGVTVTSKEYPRTLEIGKHYLLFLRFNNYRGFGPSSVAVISAGNQGMFSYDMATDRISSLSDDISDVFVADVMARSGGGFLGSLRSSLAAEQGASKSGPLSPR